VAALARELEAVHHGRIFQDLKLQAIENYLGSPTAKNHFYARRPAKTSNGE